MSQLFVLSWNSFGSLFVYSDFFEHTYDIVIISSPVIRLVNFRGAMSWFCLFLVCFQLDFWIWVLVGVWTFLVPLVPRRSPLNQGKKLCTHKNHNIQGGGSLTGTRDYRGTYTQVSMVTHITKHYGGVGLTFPT